MSKNNRALLLGVLLAAAVPAQQTSKALEAVHNHPAKLAGLHLAPVALTSGVPVDFALPAVTASTLFVGDYGFKIAVPAGAQRLIVRLSTATPGADVDLFVRRNAEVALAAGRAVADYLSEGLTGEESVTVENPPAATYYIGFGLFTRNLRVNSTIVATVEGGGSPPTPAISFPDNALFLPRFIAGAGWTTAVHIINPGAANEEYTVRFFGADGKPQRTSIEGAGDTDTVTRSARGGAVATIAGTGTVPTEGWAVVVPKTPAVRILGYVVQRNESEGQVLVEVSTPLSAPSRRAVLMFDHQSAADTTIVLLNPSGAGPVQLAATAKDTGGAVLTSDTFAIPALGQVAFRLAERYPATAEKRGSLQFESTPSGAVAVAQRVGAASLSMVPVFEMP